jgi:hypothetical protein
MKVGIVADNYKLEEFYKELKKKGFTNYETFPFNEESTLIKVEVESSQQKEVEKICKRVELHFKRSN